MSADVLIAMGVFAGILVIIIAVVVISLRQTNIELKNIRVELQQTFNSKLLEMRLEAYPPLYRLLGEFDSTVRFDTVSRMAVITLLNQILDWDTRNAILLSGNATRALYDFRRILADFAQMPEDEFFKRFTSLEERKRRIQEANKVELALKSDLGIYVEEFSDNRKDLDAYRAIADVIQKQTTQRGGK